MCIKLKGAKSAGLADRDWDTLVAKPARIVLLSTVTS
jgi:hypothetical protein